jgi:ABC-type transport system involved in cytochrome bd biosynthesis fused ATPase/permease subunit
MNEITGLLSLAIALVLLLAAILMPIFVFLICNHVEAMRKSLADMQHMMRHGK